MPDARVDHVPPAGRAASASKFAIDTARGGRLFSLALCLPADGLKAIPHEPVVMRHHAEMHVAARRQEIDHGLVIAVGYSVARAVHAILRLDAQHIKRHTAPIDRLQHRELAALDVEHKQVDMAGPVRGQNVGERDALHLHKCRISPPNETSYPKEPDITYKRALAYLGQVTGARVLRGAIHQVGVPALDVPSREELGNTTAVARPRALMSVSISYERYDRTSSRRPRRCTCFSQRASNLFCANLVQLRRMQCCSPSIITKYTTHPTR